jgi:DNA-binding transcriptional LysR family regulator
MNIRDFRLLNALAEHRHFARAAEACHISQPAFSARLQSLEQSLGVRIVERGARFQRFTVEGERVLGWSRRIVALADGMQQDMASAQGALQGQLRLAAIPSQLLAAGELAAAMKELHPNVDVAIVSRTSRMIDLALDHYECDVGLSYVDAERPPSLACLPIYAERYVAIVPERIAAFGEDTLRWRDAAGLPLALLNTEMQNRRIIDDAFRQAGVTVEAVIESDTFAALLGAVRTGDVATILPDSHADVFAALKGVRQHGLVEPDLVKTIGLVSPKREPALPLTSAFITLAAQRFAV